MTKNEWRKRVKDKKVKLNLNKVLKFSGLNQLELSKDDKGNINTALYCLNSAIIFDLNILNCIFYDKETWKEELNNLKYSLDNETLNFIDKIIHDMWHWGCEVKGDPKQNDIYDIDFELPVFTEYVMWKIYLFINEIHKYLYNKPAFKFAEQITNNKEVEDFINYIVDIKRLRHDLWVLCDAIVEVENKND